MADTTQTSPVTTDLAATEAALEQDDAPSRWATWLASALVGLIVLLFAFVVVRPFDVPADPEADSVATAWNKTIGRLGIISVYPPTEDFSVGDIWAVVADSDDTPMLGKGMRLWRIDMRSKILDSSVSPVFADTSDNAADAPDGAAPAAATGTSAYGAPPAPAKKARPRSRLEVKVSNPDQLIPLTLTAFPGVTISHIRKSNAAAGMASGWFGFGRDQQEQEDIQIKGVETYGASSVDSITAIKQFCRADATKLLCRDDVARNALAMAVDSRVLATKDGAFTTRINLQLVTRVFMTREIAQRRYAVSAGGGAAQLQTNPSASQTSEAPAVTGTDTDSAKRVAAAVETLSKSLGSSGAQGARIALVRSDGQDIGLNETFERPLIFGYRAVSIALKPSQPRKDALP